MERKITLLNTLAADQVSGGNIYNLEMGAAITKLGFLFEHVHSIDPFDYLMKLNDDEVCLVDSIVLRTVMDWNQLTRKKIIILLHMCPSFGAENEEERGLLSNLESLVFKKFPVISAGANNQDFIINEYGVRKNDTVVIPPGVPETWGMKTEYAPLPRKLLTLGSLQRPKGLDLVREVLQYNRKLDWEWHHYGPIVDHSYAAILFASIEEAGIQNKITFHGSVDYANINTIMLDHDLLLHFSKHENNPMVIREAIASRLPFMSTPVGDWEHLKNSNIGFITSSHDDKDISSALNRFLTDKTSYDSLCQGLRFMKINSWDEVGYGVVDFIDKRKWE